jgi:Amidohydrolase
MRHALRLALGRIAAAGFCAALLSACASSPVMQNSDAYEYAGALAPFKPGSTQCHTRTPQDVAVVDAHLHMKTFAGASIPYPDMLSHLRRAGVVFANVYGIGQTLPEALGCEYYLDCPGVPVSPSLTNDLANARDVKAQPPEGLVLTLSMTFPDLANPESIPGKIALLDRDYPGMFRWVGEVNVVKQALVKNQNVPVTAEVIPRWAPVMEILRKRGIPLALHSDLGDDAAPTKNLALMEEILRRYPRNRIVWMHMGLSRELTKMNPKEHTALMDRLLDEHPNLSLDISWRVLQDAYFSKPDIRPYYVALLNRYPTRFLPGTDFLARHIRTFEDYRAELEATSDILRSVDDTAFRDIALGQNYFDMLHLPYAAPAVCSPKTT